MKSTAAALLVIALVVCPAFAQAPPRLRVHGRVADSSHLALPGVTVTLTPLDATPATPQVTVTDGTGTYQFEVRPGRYALTAELSGFEKAALPEVKVATEDVTLDLDLKLAGFTEETQVVAQVPRLMSASEPAAPATVDKDVIKIAPVQGLRYDSALPLLPTVVRGPDGLISLGGARGTQGLVLVDGRRESDPVTGEPAVTVPIAAIDTVQVFMPSAPAEAGPTTAGVTQINTRRGADVYAFTASTFFPRPRFGGGRSAINGIESWQPNFGASGPIVRNVAWFTEGVEYRWERFQNDTPAGLQDTTLNAFSSFTRVDVRVSNGHVLAVRLSLHPEDRSHLGIGAFTSAGSVPDMMSRAWSASLASRITSGANGIELVAHMKRRRFRLSPGGSGNYEIGHDLYRGSYYRTVNRNADRIEASAAWWRTWSGWYGEHVVKAGVAAARANVIGEVMAQPVDYLRSDGTMSKRVEFFGPGALRDSEFDAGGFAQDSWTPMARLKIDVGVRWDYGGLFSGQVVAPRAVVTFALDDRTRLSGSAGYFAGKPVLNAGIFSQRQSRQVTSYDPEGHVTSVERYTNVVERIAIPGATIAHVQIDRTLSAAWTLRLSFQERHGRQEGAIEPVPGPGGFGQLVLASAGTSRARGLEVSAGYRAANATRQFYISYVRASSVGNLNDINTVTGTFAPALVLPDARAPLTADVPHRLLAWGLLALPWRITFAPFLEVRSGFPFTPIDEDWNPVGPRNGARFPVFASLDVAIEKAFKLPIGPPMRLGIKLFNLTGRNNGRDIQADIARADYGQTFNPIRRQFRASLEIVWNK